MDNLLFVSLIKNTLAAGPFPTYINPQTEADVIMGRNRLCTVYQIMFLVPVTILSDTMHDNKERL